MSPDPLLLMAGAFGMGVWVCNLLDDLLQRAYAKALRSSLVLILLAAIIAGLSSQLPEGGCPQDVEPSRFDSTDSIREGDGSALRAGGKTRQRLQENVRRDFQGFAGPKDKFQARLGGSALMPLESGLGDAHSLRHALLGQAGRQPQTLQIRAKDFIRFVLQFN